MEFHFWKNFKKMGREVNFQKLFELVESRSDSEWRFIFDSDLDQTKKSSACWIRSFINSSSFSFLFKGYSFFEKWPNFTVGFDSLYSHSAISRVVPDAAILNIIHFIPSASRTTLKIAGWLHNESNLIVKFAQLFSNESVHSCFSRQ